MSIWLWKSGWLSNKDARLPIRDGVSLYEKFTTSEQVVGKRSLGAGTYIDVR